MTSKIDHDAKALDALEQSFNYRFKNEERALKALTHSSASGSRGSKGGGDYERLEFLGDRVVNLIVADLLFQAFPEEQEGDMARRHTAFVRGEALAKAAQRIGIDAYIRLSASEKAAGGAQNKNILADVMEALIAAFYLDAGYQKSYEFLKGILHSDIMAMEAPPIDPKTALQEWSQARGFGLPDYQLKDRRGPDHAPEFVVSVEINALNCQEEGRGSSKRAAEKAAAKALLESLKNKKV